MDPRRIIEEIESLRERNTPVEYVDAFERERPFGKITFIVVATRADLGAVVAGGRIKKLLKKYGIIRVVAEEELIVRRYRLEKARRRAKGLIGADALFEEFLKYPRVDRKALKNSIDGSYTVAYSGGADSKASARLLEYAGAKVERLYVKMPRPISIRIPPEARVVEAPPNAYEEVVKASLEGKYHPCGRCSRIIERTAIANASNDVVVFGHLLPTGVGSIRIEEKIIRSLPASLAMTKADTVYLATEGKMDYDYKFGCMLLHQLHKKYPRMRLVSIRRVIREAVAGILMPSQAYEYIKSILTRDHRAELLREEGYQLPSVRPDASYEVLA